MNDFINALKNNSIEIMRNIPKVDIHNHSNYSCTLKYLLQNGVELPERDVHDIASLNYFCRTYINPIQYTVDGVKLLLKGNFENCINTGVTIVAPSIDYKVCVRVFNNDVNAFIRLLNTFQYDNLKILWDIGISRDSFKKEHFGIIMDLINSNFFAGIDLYATENFYPNDVFVPFYQLANEKNMITKVHAGEQLDASYVKSCIIDFSPKQIQHGITIVDDEETMRLAKDKGIVFNVCPSSNVVLKYVKDIKNHPIRKMYDFGLKVTIGTDDLLFFDSNINEEYYKLYNNHVLSAEELESIRKFGIELMEKYNN